MQRKILQIMPADGSVYARFKKSNCSDASVDKVHCWALVEDDEGTSVKAMIIIPNCGELDFADCADNFVEIYERTR